MLIPRFERIKAVTQKAQPTPIWGKHWRREHYMGHTIDMLGAEKLQIAVPDCCLAG